MKRPLLIALLLAGTAASVPAQQRSIDEFFATFTAEWLRLNPNQAASTRFFSGEEQRQFERQLTPLTPEWRRRRVALAQRALEELNQAVKSARRGDLSRNSGLTDVQVVSTDLMRWQLDTLIRSDRFSDYFFPFEQFGGANVGLVSTMTVSHPVVTEGDAENYVARLGQVALRLDEAIAEARRIAALGLIPPRFIIRATLAQMQQFVAAPPSQNPLVASFSNRMASAPAIPEARRPALAAEAEKVVASQIYPAWQRAMAVVQPLEAKATDDAGLWRFKDGAAVYAEMLRRYTTTSLSADEIHQIGLTEVARIEKEMDSILRKLGRPQGSVKDRIDQLKKDLGYPLTEDGRTKIMADVEQIMRDAEKRAASQFDRRPKAPVVARPFQRFQEANAAANYTAPARDGSRPGIFQIPLRPERMTKFSLRSLVYHETVPGHHFQLALELENTEVPTFRQLRVFGPISAFSEGWGLYAERLAAESGWYEGDPEGLLGQLDSALFRARRLVVDTGLHAKRWTRQQAIDFGIEVSEVERYVVNPGQACSYMIGQLKIVELREKARAALGPRFSLSEFHNLVLGTGSVPLELLERQVDAFIGRRAGV
jgi:uncharacterized protein (DUF885 family)